MTSKRAPKKPIKVRECIEPGAENVSRYNAKLDDEQYERAMLAFPVMCVDIIAINREWETFYLLPRILIPKKGWWCIGGRVLRGEPLIVAALRKLKQEVGLEINGDRLSLVAFHRYITKQRQQQPRETGADTPTWVYCFEPTPAERVIMNANLDPREYLTDGLREFTRDQMTGLDPALIMLYDDIFAR